MHNKIVKVAALALGIAFTGTVSAWSSPVMSFVAAGGNDAIPIAKKKKTANRGPVLLGRVEDIDRRERKAVNRRGGKLVGRVPTKGRTQQNDGFNRFMQGFALGTVQALAGAGGASGGCGIDVTTPNPTGCGTHMGNGGGNNGLRPPYQCPVNGRIITTNTFRAGCWMVRQNNTTIHMGR